MSSVEAMQRQETVTEFINFVGKMIDMQSETSSDGTSKEDQRDAMLSVLNIAKTLYLAQLQAEDILREAGMNPPPGSFLGGSGSETQNL